MDGNFSAEHMKMRRQENDTPITDGTGFMVEAESYSKHLEIASGRTEVFIPRPSISLQLSFMSYSGHHAITTKQ
jgi:hypothetical protein